LTGLPAPLKTKVLGVESDPPSFHTLWRLTVPALFRKDGYTKIEVGEWATAGYIEATLVTANTMAVFVGVGGVAAWTLIFTKKPEKKYKASGISQFVIPCVIARSGRRSEIHGNIDSLSGVDIANQSLSCRTIHRVAIRENEGIGWESRTVPIFLNARSW